jgi:hypothetical protein
MFACFSKRIVTTKSVEIHSQENFFENLKFQSDTAAAATSRFCGTSAFRARLKAVVRIHHQGKIVRPSSSEMIITTVDHEALAGIDPAFSGRNCHSPGTEAMHFDMPLV